MQALSCDLETYSSVDLTKCGVYAYTEAPDFEILLLSYAFNDDPVQVVDLANGEVLPHSVAEALFDPGIIKTAFNANFERTALAKHFGRELPPEQWQCTAVHALTLGLPQSLEAVGKTLDLSEDKAKMTAGKALIRYFCVPCKPTKRNGGRTRNLPQHDPEKWALFKDYCVRDVETERTIRQKLMRFDVHPEERRLWALDQRINDRGVMVDQEMVRHAITCDTSYSERLEAEAVQLTGLDNPQSVAQLKRWLSEAEGLEVEQLTKDTVPELLKQTTSETVRRVLELRQEMSRTSVKKYEAMQRSVCRDSRIRGLLQFYGANRTGRWAGRLVQVQNLPQNHLEDLDLARRLLREGDYELLELLFGNVPDTLSQLIRTAFIPVEGHRFIVADFSSIEARVIAWLAGEQWRLDVFKTHGKIYEASASQMFKVPIEQITKGSPLRQRGKVAELALGYQGGKGALLKMDKKKELIEDELPDLVEAWRKASPHIVQLWWDTEAAAIRAVQERTSIPLHHGVVYTYEAGVLFAKLPSGRRLAYAKPKIKTDQRFGKPALTYQGLNQETKQWGRLDTYGGKLVENCLAGDALVLTDRGWIELREVEDDDALWDGVEWVSHDGLVSKGVRETIELDGVRMTLDHRVLTSGGWRYASSCEGYFRHEVTLPDGHSLCRFRWEEILVDDTLRLRSRVGDAGFGVPEGKTEVLWVPTQCRAVGSEVTRNVEASSILGVEINAGSVPSPITPRLGELRGPRDQGMPSVGCELRGFLGRHGADLSARVVAGSHRCEQGLLPGELPVGCVQDAKQQSEIQPVCRHSVGTDDGSRGSGTFWNTEDDTDLSPRSRVPSGPFIRRPGRYEPVYDILNCGPRSRFVVMGKSGPFIVHNCVQAIARDCLAVAMLRLADAGHKIVFHVHDEFIIEAPEGVGSVKHVAELAGQPISWAPGLPLRADGFEATYYRKD